MKRVVLLYKDETPRIARVVERLRSYFGPRRAITGRGSLPAITDDDVVVVLLSETATAGNDNGGLPLDDMAQLEASGIDGVFAGGGMVVPVLLNGAAMPAHTTLPESIRKLAFRHALPLRLDIELDRDLGRLIEDIEIHIEHYPGNMFPWDYWLMPIGIVGSLLFSAFLFLWLADVIYWNYGYETVQRYREARFSLTMVGPGLLGTFLLLVGVAVHFRRYRRRAAERTEHFHTGTGQVPEFDALTMCAALTLSLASVGWGWWGGVPAILCAGIAFVRRALGFSRHIAWRGLLAALMIATFGISWAAWRTSVVERFEVALGAYERGAVAEKADRIEEAKRLFQTAIDAFPRCGNAYQGLGSVYVRSGDVEAAYHELSNAIDRYPTEPRGYFEPDRKMVVAAYENRARVAEKLGHDAQAERDRKMADQLAPWFTFFGGAFRWW